MGPMKMKSLEMLLQTLEPLAKPRADLEQYHTPAPVAARLLYTALGNGHIAGCKVARYTLDLTQCGTGILGIGAAFLGASTVTGFDSDTLALEKARRNVKALAGRMEIEPVFGHSTANDFYKLATREGQRWDTVVMNPPFGAQVKGADRPFLVLALASGDAVYSIHRAGTEDFVRRMAEGAGFEVTWEETAAFTIPHMFDFHEKERENIGVTLFCMLRR